MVEVYMYQAYEGDFLRIRYGKDKFTNIIVDGGTKNTTTSFQRVLKSIVDAEEIVEAMFLSHIDNDHIEGLLNGLSYFDVETLKKHIKKIYFNTCRGIAREQNLDIDQTGYAEDQLLVKDNENAYGVGEAITLLTFLRDTGMKSEGTLVDYTLQGETIELENGAVLKIISPGKEELNKFAFKWEKYAIEHNSEYYGNSGPKCQDLSSFDKLKATRLGSDKSVNNLSSIAFLFEYEDVKAAFLGDAGAGVCMNGLKKFNISDRKPYAVDLMKVSHHGSKNNTSDSLIRALPTENYLFSTNANSRKVPHKVVLAHLLKIREVVHIFANYSWWVSPYKKYFTVEDEEKYCDTGKLTYEQVRRKGTKIKDGLMVYGEK